jgi:uncharacterized protein
MTDNEVTAALLEAASDDRKVGHLHARRIVRRKHFKRVYERNPEDVKINPEAGNAVFEALNSGFGAEQFRHDRYQQRSGAPDFPVRMRDGQIVSSLAVSETLNTVPVVSVDYIFADRSIYDRADDWLKKNRIDIITPKQEEESNGST